MVLARADGSFGALAWTVRPQWTASDGVSKQRAIGLGELRCPGRSRVGCFVSWLGHKRLVARWPR